MDVEALRTYCLSKPGASEDMPFGETVLAMRLLKKIFALISLDDIPSRVNFKCDPEHASELRERYSSVLASYYGGKWIMVELEGDIPSTEIKGLVDRSYDLVKAGLPKKERLTLSTS